MRPRVQVEAILASRAALGPLGAAGRAGHPAPGPLPAPDGLPSPSTGEREAEGGCGVVGLASTRPVRARHLHRALVQMHNRGNGKGGGICAVGLSPSDLGVSAEVLERDFLIQVAYLDGSVRRDVEREFIEGPFEVAASGPVPMLADYRELPGLAVRPPEVWRYFCHPRPERLESFARESGLTSLPADDLADELVYQNTYRLNTRFYASLGEKRAFVLSHGRDMVVLKVVGHAEDVLEYYRMGDVRARVWIGHQRFPTKGRVWHPGGAHPFIGVHDALVHNGDFANYHSICEYLAQRHIRPQFLTDTEVAILLFDLYSRTYGYGLEQVFEALAPTTERDFELLDADRRETFRDIQTCHIHGSPDGPWFFIVARNDRQSGERQLVGITDTSMLRPQVFALQRGPEPIGLIASERQAIDATLRSIAAEHADVLPIADQYWNARGGSVTDGGAFVFSIGRSDGRTVLRVRDKFGREVGGGSAPRLAAPVEVSDVRPPPDCAGGDDGGDPAELGRLLAGGGPPAASDRLRSFVAAGRLRAFRVGVEWLARAGARGFVSGTGGRAAPAPPASSRRRRPDPPPSPPPAVVPPGEALSVLSLLADRCYDVGTCRRASILTMVLTAVDALLDEVPLCGREVRGPWLRVDEGSALRLCEGPGSPDATLVLDASGLPAEGEAGPSMMIVRAVRLRWRRLVVYRMSGQRFVGCGLGPSSDGVQIDIWGPSGDYLGSGLDGGSMTVHGSAQDQVGQILMAGTLVVHGDVGQTFMYGAKGGEVYVRGNAAGRPLINAVGRPRVVINGTCLDYLAESFMAGDPLAGGGFVVVNGITHDDAGRLVALPTPYPGGNLFSLASGGAIYLRDPHRRVGDDQLNGGAFTDLTDADWDVVRPMLEANERLLGIRLLDLLTVEGQPRSPHEVYRKVRAVPLKALQATGI